MIDADMLAVPDPSAHRSDAEVYLANLANILNLARDRSIVLYGSDDALAVLEREGLGVPWTGLNDHTHLTVADFMAVYYGIIDRVMSVHLLGSAGVALGEILRISPDQHYRAKSPSLREDYESLLVQDALVQLCGGTHAAWALLCPHFDSPVRVSYDAKFHSCELQEYEGRSVAGKELLHGNEVFSLLESLPLYELLGTRRSLGALHLAIQLESIRTGSQNLTKAFKLHSTFLDSLNHLLSSGVPGLKERVFRACLDTIFMRRESRAHALRVSSGGGAAQRQREVDGWKAMRRDVDHEYHLHYWTGGSEVEFACVVPHNSFEIPE